MSFYTTCRPKGSVGTKKNRYREVEDYPISTRLTASYLHISPFHEQGSEARSGATSERVEDEEALKTRALVGQFADAIDNRLEDLFADGVMTASVVVSGIFLAYHECE